MSDALFPLHQGAVPYLSTAQMVAVDRLMIETYQIELLQMMENAGRCLAELARQRFLRGDPRRKHVTVLAGSGGNGGGALVCARRLHNYGANVRIVLSRAAGQFTSAAARQLQILQNMGLPLESTVPSQEPAAPDLVVDGLIGYSLRGAPRGAAADLIRWANALPAPVLALDVPSGLDSTNGQVSDPTMRAAATMTLALPKAGLRPSQARLVVGELYLADISVPPELYSHPGLDLQVGPLFAGSDILRLW